MTQYAVVIAIENYHNPDRISKVDFAENDAQAIRLALIGIGFFEENITYIVGERATRATIENELNKIAKLANSNDQIILYYAGHGFNENGINLISCVDTDIGALGLTCLSIPRILEILNRSESKRSILFLDCCHSGIEFSESHRGGVNQLSTDDLKYQFVEIEYLTCFASCKGDEKSWPDRIEKHGIWTNYLLKVLSGDVDEVYESGLVFSDKLQQYLLTNTRQRAREVTKDKVTQTPVKYGKEMERFIVADVSCILNKKRIENNHNGIELSDVQILGIESGNVRNLPGFIKGKHKEPNEINDYHEGWIRKISTDLVKEKIDEIENSLNEKLNFKRKDIQSVTVDSGSGQITTKYFDYSVEVMQSKKDAGKYVIKKELANFAVDFDLMDDETFNECFDREFDSLFLPISGSISVETVIDKIEEIDDDSIISVIYNRSDLSSCKVVLPEFSGEIVVRKNSIKVRAHAKLSPGELVSMLDDCNRKLSASNLNLLE